MPKRDPQYLAQRKLELAEAAMRCFTSKGYHATSISDICKEAKVSIGTLYKHFDGKRDMWMTSYERQLSERSTLEGEFSWPEFRDLLIEVLTGLEDKDYVGMIACSLELTADGLRDRGYADWAESQTREARKFLMHKLRRLRDAGEITLPLGAGTTERMLRSILFGAVTQYIWEATVPGKKIVAEVAQTLDHLVGAE